ncbi:2-oxoglutarate dehydrogenase, E2 component, dihydrolipoamide succinyltransferase [Nakamurella endophytica]|uniref:Dihydrolipoamide acetyltransferase component of pyruvate dehydrogenase complex n=1 Tax=Nakamurella endophytica TaxID=1748367 RepID=A0A917T339_9ACTN|nr:2-oxoglutarate dehydrogenase, E2 component, dihydrolipoamide succinyltransferase [Nakamurella endophytica]GGM06617.1 dihydrolipoamide acetyltransferase component of pyruvate dehydrogenase complex [Nakamurella endophytica]
MSHSVQMPALGESVTEGTVTRWLKAEGDRVEVDEPLLEVSTDKVDTEIPSPVAGVLERIVVAEDDVAQVGAELAVIGDGSGAGASGGGQAAPDAAAAPAPAEPATPSPQPEPEAAPQASAPVEAPSPDTDVPAEKPVADAAPAGGAADSTVVSLPAMGESVTEGTVTRWLKQVGDTVAVDEPLLEVSTDKVDTEVPSPVAGTVLEISVGEDETVQVGGRLAVIGTPGAAPAAPPASAPEPDPAPRPEETRAPQTVTAGGPTASDQATATPEPAAPVTPPVQQSAPAPAPTAAPAAAPAPASVPDWSPAPVPTGTYVTPVIRKLAADSGVDLATVKGSGVGGRIRREDVVAAAEAQRAAAEAEAARSASSTSPAAAAAAPAASAPATPSAAPKADAATTALIGTTQKLPRIRQSIAKNMLHGLQTAAQLTTVIEVDVTRVANLRAKAKAGFQAREGVNLSYLPFFVKAAVEALKLYPVVNSSLSDDLKEITYHGKVHLGIAVDTPRGLIVPVIKDADDLNLGGIARKIADLAQRTRDNKIGPDELSGGTFTVTNTGSVGALFDTPIFVPPQSAILGTGAIVRRPVVVTDADGNEVIGIRSMAYLAMSYDHRNIDGADASRFLQAVKRRIEDGDFAGDLGL